MPAEVSMVVSSSKSMVWWVVLLVLDVHLKKTEETSTRDPITMTVKKTAELIQRRTAADVKSIERIICFKIKSAFSTNFGNV